MNIRKLIIATAFSLLGSLLIFTPANAQIQIPWDQFVKELRIEALAQGIRAEIFDEAFRDIRAPSAKIVHFEKTQPEKRLTFLQYRSTRADPARIRLGRQEYHRNQSILEKIGNEYGVNPCFIVSLWGMETSYGHFMGNFPVIQSLATLAYTSARGAYFKKQLMIALRMLNDGQVSLSDFKGEWAGASGQPQFMPSTWQEYAVDYSGEGRRDIWHNLGDVFASIANVLVKNGWQRGQPWAVKVELPAGFDREWINNKSVKTVEEWTRLGVRPASGSDLDNNLTATIIEPAGGPAFMIFKNFQVLMRWNHSSYYVGSVGYMAEQICQKEI